MLYPGCVAYEPDLSGQRKSCKPTHFSGPSPEHLSLIPLEQAGLTRQVEPARSWPDPGHAAVGIEFLQSVFFLSLLAVGRRCMARSSLAPRHAKHEQELCPCHAFLPMLARTKMLYTRAGTRTLNLLLRGEAPYPLGHTSSCQGERDLQIRSPAGPDWATGSLCGRLGHAGLQRDCPAPESQWPSRAIPPLCVRVFPSSYDSSFLLLRFLSFRWTSSFSRATAG